MTPALKKAARALAWQPGVVGVFFGNGRKAGKWGRDDCVVVHVMRKVHVQHLGSKRLPEKVAGFEVDVLEVGTPRAHALDVVDEVVAEGAGTRAAGFTALLATEAGALALLSGHLALPCAHGRIVNSYDDRDDPPFGITARDRGGNTAYQGRLIRGDITAYSDWSLAIFPDAKGSQQLDPRHPLLGVPPRFKVRDTPLAPGEPLQHFSPVTGKVQGGTVQHEAITETQPVTLPDGSPRIYSGLFAVAGDDGDAFSRPRDSGSLVFDGNGQAVGTVLAGSEIENISYVLPLDAMQSGLGSIFARFFSA